MIDLFAITSMSDIMIDFVMRSRLKNKAIVFTTNTAVYDYLTRFMPVYFIGFDDRELNKDASFYNDFMPGNLKGIKMPGSDLEAWKVLSIDRFKFWYAPKSSRVHDLLVNVAWDRVFVSLDMGTPLINVIMATAKEKGRPCIAIKTEPIRTTEMLDMAPLFWFEQVVVDNEDEEKFLRSAGLRKKTKIFHLNRRTDGLAESPLRDALRERIGATEDEKVVGVLFDKRDEWQISVFVSAYFTQKGASSDFSQFFIVPVDRRSGELAKSSLPQFSHSAISTPEILQACDEIFAFRWDDIYCIGLPAPLKIIDYKGVNRARKIAPKPDVVMEVQ